MDKQVKTVFSEIEMLLLEAIKSVKPSNKEIYACGLWLFYCDYTVISPPCFGYNTVYEEGNGRWAPPEWDEDVVSSVFNALTPIYEELSVLMDGKSDKAWEELIGFQWTFYSKLCFKLNAQMDSDSSPFKGWNINKDFVIGIFEEREGEEIYNKLVIDSIGEDKARSLCII